MQLMQGLSRCELGKSWGDGHLFNGTEVSTAHMLMSEGIQAHLSLRGAVRSFLALLSHRLSEGGIQHIS